MNLINRQLSISPHCEVLTALLRAAATRSAVLLIVVMFYRIKYPREDLNLRVLARIETVYPLAYEGRKNKALSHSASRSFIFCVS